MYYPPERRRDWNLFARQAAEHGADEFELDGDERAHLVSAWARWAQENTADHEPDAWGDYVVWLRRKALRRFTVLGIWSLAVSLLLAVAPVGGGKAVPIALILLAALPLLGSLAVAAGIEARRVDMYRRAVTRAYEIMRRDPSITYDLFCGEMGRANIRHFVRHRGERALHSYWLYYSEWNGRAGLELVAA